MIKFYSKFNHYDLLIIIKLTAIIIMIIKFYINIYVMCMQLCNLLYKY